jgi:dTDP-4-amino-4,6-dideoxygalactose transaminase
MTFYGDLPPVGHPISLRTEPENNLAELLGGHQYWVDSGTSALALAVLDAKTYFPGLQQARVIIPGYCCPDLVAACIYAGVEPVVVDIEENDPAYNCECLRAQLDERVIAVIAVNFLGITERLNELRQLIGSLGLRTRLIEDNAQWFPRCRAEVPADSDYAIFSFGRGKPLSLLGGGLLVARVPIADSVAAHIDAADTPSLLLPLKMRAYNLLLSPLLYMLLNRNPFMRLGETTYIALKKIQALDSFRRSLLNTNFARYVTRKPDLKIDYDEALIARGLQQLAAVTTPRTRQLLRYPLLCSSAACKDYLLLRLGQSGLGATAMYPCAIDKITGVDELVCVPEAIVNAQNFARRFITLPMHAGVTQVYRKRILAILREAKPAG